MRAPRLWAAHAPLLALLCAGLACNTVFPPRPALEWDTRPEALIVEASTGGGMLYEPNAMPEATLWGDGRLVWIVTGSGGARQVLAATLTPDQMRALLAELVNAGFYGWEAHYSPGIVYDAPSTCLRVSLQSDTHAVCETLSGAPRAFHRLYNDLAAGHGLAGLPFVPARGFLRVTGLATSTATAEWPAALGVSLAEVAETGGQWLEGEALAVAWNTINLAPLNPILHDGEAYYQAQLMVPGLTALQPPEAPAP